MNFGNNVKMKKPNIRYIEVKPKKLEIKDWKLRSALDSDYSTLYTENVGLVVDGKVKVIYLDLDELGLDFTDITRALNTIKFHTSQRTAGLKSTSRVFGYQPRNQIHRDYCTSTSLAVDFPKEHRIICDYAKKIDEIYQAIDPETYKKHKEMSDKVLKDWTIEESLFTSGIVNKNNPLKYHFDTGNFKDVYSCMLGFKKNVKGGYLACPEYDCAFEIKNNSLHIFDGQNILHGVTPFVKLSQNAYRYTLVYYSLKQMWSCLPLGAELERIRKRKTEREFRRLQYKTIEDVPDKLTEQEIEADTFKDVR